MPPDLPLLILAFDHRTSLVRGLFDGDADAAAERAPSAKTVVLQGLLTALEDDPNGGRYRPGVLVDAQYGANVARGMRDSPLSVSMAIERSGQAEIALEYSLADLAPFEPDYVKALVRFNAEDDEGARQRQLATLSDLSADLQNAGIKFMFELLVPPLPEQLDAVGGDRARYDAELRPALTVKAIEAIKAAGVVADLWKLEGPGDAASAAAVASAAAPAPCLVLGRGADAAAVDRWLRVAAPTAGFGGFAIGRSIWWDAIRDWLAGGSDASDAAARIAANYRGFVATYLDASAG